jgi:hypothetical protein
MTTNEPRLRCLMKEIEDGGRCLIITLADQEYLAYRDGSSWFYGPKADPGQPHSADTELDVLEGLVAGRYATGREVRSYRSL